MAIYYIETTIPSFYHEVRAEPEMVARRDWTRRWYDVAVASYLAPLYWTNFAAAIFLAAMIA